MKWICNECGTVPCYLEVKDSGDELIEFLSEVIENETEKVRNEY